ncbi:hypothetical protein JD844_026896 [Phrynosoma platyrhinos]|uniref:H/ACA ribonucleoprotein complex subunit n=1 Tax=Phrynosoma platyrhinos TaxID=52577 RepID=A0ABQ7SFG2_PHRPL|nr:hypothetical protein JD844_026896 [Phrynosoma platyrhinos]
MPMMEGNSSSSSSSTSSDSESDSESDTDTDSSSSDSSSSCLPMLSEDDDDQQSKNEDNSCTTTTNGEMSKQEPLCVEDVTIILPESVELMPFGKISSIIGHLVIVESQKGLPPVNEDTVLFRDDRRSVGKVFEVFGPVSHPFYVLQFNSPEHIEAKDIKIHDAVYFAPSVESFTQYIFPEKIRQEKGSDASWMNDLEPPPEALDFSDDEKERAAKQQKKSQKLRRKKLRSLQDYDKYDILKTMLNQDREVNEDSGQMIMELITSPDNSSILQTIQKDIVGENLTPPFQAEDSHILHLNTFLDLS